MYDCFLGYWLLVTGCWILVAGYWLLVAGYWSLVTGGRHYSSVKTFCGLNK